MNLHYATGLCVRKEEWKITTQSNQIQNVFPTCSVHLFNWPYEMLKGDPPTLHRQGEAIAKMDRFCHRIYKVPITWLCTCSALQRICARLRGYDKVRS